MYSTYGHYVACVLLFREKKTIFVRQQTYIFSLTFLLFYFKLDVLRKREFGHTDHRIYHDYELVQNELYRMVDVF